MSLIVSDTGPLRYLVLCRQVNLLGVLYQQLVIPQAVARDLSNDRTPKLVKMWCNHLPTWAVVGQPASLVDDLGLVGEALRQVFPRGLLSSNLVPHRRKS